MLRWNGVFVIVSSLDVLSIDLFVKIDVISGLGIFYIGTVEIVAVVINQVVL